MDKSYPILNSIQQKKAKKLKASSAFPNICRWLQKTCRESHGITVAIIIKIVFLKKQKSQSDFGTYQRGFEWEEVVHLRRQNKRRKTEHTAFLIRT